METKDWIALAANLVGVLIMAGTFVVLLIVEGRKMRADMTAASKDNLNKTVAAALESVGKHAQHEAAIQQIEIRLENIKTNSDDWRREQRENIKRIFERLDNMQGGKQ